MQGPRPDVVALPCEPVGVWASLGCSRIWVCAVRRPSEHNFVHSADIEHSLDCERLAAAVDQRDDLLNDRPLRVGLHFRSSLT